MADSRTLGHGASDERFAVKDGLTMKRHRETPEVAAMMRRMLPSWRRRVVDGDPSDLAELLTFAKLLDDAIRASVTGQRAMHGTSWAAIGDAAGVTRQAAQQRWGHQVEIKGIQIVEDQEERAG